MTFCLVGASAQTIQAGSVGGEPGWTVWFDVTFDPQGVSVAATMNRIVFDRFNTPVSTCVIGDVPDKSFSFKLLPDGCSPGGANGQVPCSSGTVIVWDGATASPHAILTPVVLYRCQVNIPAAASGGTYPLVVDTLSATDPPGNAEGLAGISGNVVVVVSSSGGSGGGGGGSCAILPSTRSPVGFLVLAIGGSLFAGLRHFRSRRKVRFTPITLLLTLATLCPWSPVAARAVCVGDCSGDNNITIEELIAMVNIALGEHDIGSCSNGDANGDGQISVDEIITAVNNALSGCPVPFTPTPTLTFTPLPTDTPPPAPVPTNTPTQTRTQTWTLTPTATFTRTPTPTPAEAMPNLTIRVTNQSGTDRNVCVNGKMFTGSLLGADTHYGCPPQGCPSANPGTPLCKVITNNCSGTACDITVPFSLSPGEYVHEIFVQDTVQDQHQRALVLGGQGTPNLVTWKVFASVLTVTSTVDEQIPGTLRNEIQAAASSGSAKPALIQFAVTGRFDVAPSAPLELQADSITIDGTDVSGNPSPLDPIDARTYTHLVHLLTNVNATTTNLDSPIAGALMLEASLCELIGLEIDRQVPSANPAPTDPKHCTKTTSISCTDNSQCPSGEVCQANFPGVDADAIYIQPGPTPNAVTGNHVRNCRIDGGAAGKLLSSTGRDCITARASGGSSFTSTNAVENTEVRNCWDKGIKVVDAAYLHVEDSWVHDTIDTGMQTTTGLASTAGRLQSLRNLVDRAGGTAASQQSANGIAANDNSSILDSSEDVVRQSAARGIYVKGAATATIDRAFVSGTLGGGNGITFEGGSITATLQGTAVVANSGNGVALATASAISTAGNNAFAANGGIPFMGSSTAVTVGNSQWRSCYVGNDCAPGNTCNADACNLDAIRTNDKTGTVSIPSAQAHRSRAGLSIDPVLPDQPPPIWPKAGKMGTIVHIRGSGFNAVDPGNTCGASISGTCVQFVVRTRTGFAPVDAQVVLGVTPNELVVKSPVDCIRPVGIRVSRQPLSGSALLFQADGVFCVN